MVLVDMQKVQVVCTPKQSEWNPWPHLLKKECVKLKYYMEYERNIKIVVYKLNTHLKTSMGSIMIFCLHEKHIIGLGTPRLAASIASDNWQCKSTWSTFSVDFNTSNSYWHLPIRPKLNLNFLKMLYII